MSFTEIELRDAFDHYQAVVTDCARSGVWEPFADLFTEDCTYVEHAYGAWQGRERTRQWIVRTMTTFPGSAMVSFPIAWETLDVAKGWVICDVRNLMRDPGDGSHHEASNLTILRYAGDGLWREEEDVYNPTTFLTMTQGWCSAAEAAGALPEEARVWREKFGG